LLVNWTNVSFDTLSVQVLQVFSLAIFSSHHLLLSSLCLFWVAVDDNSERKISSHLIRKFIFINKLYSLYFFSFTSILYVFYAYKLFELFKIVLLKNLSIIHTFLWTRNDFDENWSINISLQTSSGMNLLFLVRHFFCLI
jgi:hypothetical protein